MTIFTNDLREQKHTHTQHLMKAFSALIQRKEALTSENTRLVWVIFSVSYEMLPITAVQHLWLKYLPYDALNSMFFGWELGLSLNDMYYYFWCKCPQCHVTPCPADPEITCCVHILHPCSPHKNEVKGRATFLSK